MKYKIILVSFLAISAISANKPNHEPLWFDLSGINRKTRVLKISDLSWNIKLISGPYGIDQYAMTALLKKLHRYIIDNKAIFVEWRNDNSLELDITQYDGKRTQAVIMPYFHSHDFSEESRMKIRNMADKMRHRNINKILKAFDNLNIN